METFIVRIYRPPKRTSRLVLGVIEQVGEKGLFRFSSFDELRRILTDGVSPPRSAPAEAGFPAVEK